METFVKLLLWTNLDESAGNAELMEHLLSERFLYGKQLTEIPKSSARSKFMMMFSNPNFQITSVDNIFASLIGHVLTTIYKYAFGFIFENVSYIRSYIKYRKKTTEAFDTSIVMEDKSKMICVLLLYQFWMIKMT